MGQAIRKDPLLTTARIGTWVVQIFLIIGMAALALAAGACLVWSLGLMPAHVEVEGISRVTPGMWAAVALTLALALASLALATRFVVRLRQIIDTVGLGDPFVADNAARLTHMAWLALIGQALMIAAGMCSGWVEAHGNDEFDFAIDVSLSGFWLAIILFILARVFREGTRMRAELEGTV